MKGMYMSIEIFHNSADGDFLDLRNAPIIFGSKIQPKQESGQRIVTLMLKK